MQTFLPFEDYTECAKVLDKLRINSQLNEMLVILRSLTGVYERNPRTGLCGWENHTVARMWKEHELQLARFALVLAEEHLYNRDLPNANKTEVLANRQKRRDIWTGLIEEMEARNCPDTKPALIGDEEFHSAFRALLLYKDIQATTYKKWKKGQYPDNKITRGLLPKKSSWKRTDYERIWDAFGRPDPQWYIQWGWKEEPDDMKVFYSEDRIPQMEKEKQRKKERPVVSFLARKK